MYKEHLKVWGEDLYNEGTPLEVVAGGTLGALQVNVYAKKAKAYSDVVVTVSAADERGGSYSEVTKNKAVSGTFSAGDLIVSIGLPADVKNWVKATSSDSDVRVTLDILR